MRFWTRLRWVASLAFVALVVVSWVGAAKVGSRSSNDRGPRAAPNFQR